MPTDKTAEEAAADNDRDQLNEIELEAAVGGSGRGVTPTVEPCIKTVDPCIKIFRSI